MPVAHEGIPPEHAPWGRGAPGGWVSAERPSSHVLADGSLVTTLPLGGLENCWEVVRQGVILIHRVNGVIFD